MGDTTHRGAGDGQNTRALGGVTVIRFAAFAVAGTLCAVLVAGCGTPSDRGRLVLHDLTLFDGTGASARSGMVVVVAGGRIDAVVPVSEYVPLPTDSIVDASGLYLIPGLWALHVHLSKTTAAALPVLLANGVTTVRDMGGVLEEVRRGGVVSDSGGMWNGNENTLFDRGRR